MMKVDLLIPGEGHHCSN